MPDASADRGRPGFVDDLLDPGQDRRRVEPLERIRVDHPLLDATVPADVDHRVDRPGPVRLDRQGEGVAWRRRRRRRRRRPRAARSPRRAARSTGPARSPGPGTRADATARAPSRAPSRIRADEVGRGDRRPLERHVEDGPRDVGRPAPGRCSARRGPPRSSPACPCFFRPAEPCPIVPAKKIPGTDALSQYGVWAGSRLWPNVVTPRSGRSRSGVDEAGRGDDLVGLDRELVAARRRPDPDDQAVAVVGPLDPADRRVEDRHAAAEDVVLERLDVARPDADERLRVDRELRRRRGGEDDPAGPRQQPGRQLEAGVLLADDEDPPAGVRLGRAGVGVVGGQLDARASAGCTARRRRPRRSRPAPGTRRRSVSRTKRSPSGPPRAGSPSSGSRSGSASRCARRRSRGSAPSPAATGSTRCRP